MPNDILWFLLCVATSVLSIVGTSLYWTLKNHYQDKQQGQQNQEQLQSGQQLVWICKHGTLFHTTSDQCPALKGNKSTSLYKCKHCTNADKRQHVE